MLQPGASRGLRDCIMIYEGDSGFIHTAQAMFGALATRPAEEGWEPILLEFPGGGHSSALQSRDWIVGCLGIVPSCDADCEAWFVTNCMAAAGGTSPERAASFRTCLDEAHGSAGPSHGCAARCAPTIEMLATIEGPRIIFPSEPVVQDH